MRSFSRCADNDKTLLKGDNNVRTTGWWRREHADHPLTLARLCSCRYSCARARSARPHVAIKSPLLLPLSGNDFD